MKKIASIIVLVFIVVNFSYCKKVEYKQRTSAGDWILVDAKLYIKRWGNYSWFKYDYFSPTQSYNVVDLTGQGLALDEIERGKTKWSLPDYENSFTLNDTMKYETQCNAWSMRVFPTENGSSRVYLLDSLTDDCVRWETSEREQALNWNGVYDNYTYKTKLLFRRVTTNNIDISMNDNLPVSGVIPISASPTNELRGKKWVIYKYKKDGVVGTNYISDTLRFISTNKYYYGTSVQQWNYALFNHSTYYTLSLDGTRFGSNITCSNIPAYAIQNGDIQNTTFKDNTIGLSGDIYYLYLKKID
jgi:hypothetical protein